MPNPSKIKAVVESVTAYGEGTYAVTMRPEGRLPRFKAGQFLHLSVDDYDPAGGFWPESRVFSIASRPGAETASIVYSVKGKYTKKMESTLSPGKELWLKLPYGEFIVDACIGPGQDVVLVAGGTGISPYIPYLEGLVEAGSGAEGRTIALYYGARQRSYVLFRDPIERCAAALPGFRATITIENESSEGLAIAGAKLMEGRLSIDAIFEETRNLRDPVFFLSGPPAMIRLFKERLAAKGVSGDNVKIDEWE
jgi:ferredoxin-NADP reductase